MTGSFDPCDKNSWYFGMITRHEAEDILSNEKEGGVFLVRDSISIKGDFVLCVKEDNKVSHYIINRHIDKRTNNEQQIRYQIGEQTFSDIPSLLSFYKLHYLDTTPLIKPATKHIEKVIARYDFEGKDSDDLPFKRGDILVIIRKDEELWWTGKDSSGREGSIPVNYVEKYNDYTNHKYNIKHVHLDNGHVSSVSNTQHQHIQSTTPVRKNHLQIQLPAYAKVIQVRVPNAYDRTALKLDIGDIIKVTKMNINGQWEGELNGKIGHFPFTHVEFIQESSSHCNEEKDDVTTNGDEANHSSQRDNGDLKST